MKEKGEAEKKKEAEEKAVKEADAKKLAVFISLLNFFPPFPKLS